MAANGRCHPSDFLTKWALSILDPFTGQYLEHLQIRRHPNLRTIWDSSHSNEMVRLCQGAVKGPTNSGKRIKDTDTFCIIRFADIPRDQRKGITFTKVVCKFFPKKEDSNCMRITIMGNIVVYVGNTGTKTASLDL